MDDKTQEKLQSLIISYTKKLPEKIDHIENLWKKIRNKWDEEQFITFHRDVHSLCGSAGTYGYSELSKTARKLEIYLKNLLNQSTLKLEDQKNISDLLNDMKKSVSFVMPQQIELGSNTQTEESQLILVIGGQEFFYFVTNLFKDSKYLFETITVNDLKQPVFQKNPSAIIANIDDLTEKEIKLFSQAKEINQSLIPLICIASKSDIITRLMAIRMGSSAFFARPFDHFSLLKLVNEFCGSSSASYRILIVDDSISLGSYYAVILEEAGMKSRAISNPLKILDAVSEFQPDLILMDIYMPECTGLEIAALLRQELVYSKIPIIFLSTEEDIFKQLKALSVGADDFLTKPITPQHLVEAVKFRAKRASILNALMTTDSLTGLLNHANFLQRLDKEIARAERRNSPLSLAMLDIDYFKKVNDTYGHLTGDLVIKKISNFFLTNLRKIDAIGRYGGEEFSIIFPDTSLEQSRIICERLIKDFSKLPFLVSGEHFFVTLSGGIASYPTYRDRNALVESADQALYFSKRNGRNRISIK